MENTRIIKQTHVGEGNRALLISTVYVLSGYETLVMKSDYEEIDGGRYGSEAEAVAAHDSFIVKYTAHGALDETALRDTALPAKYNTLTVALTEALKQARPMLETEDGGTCNFDALQIRLPHWRKDYVGEAARRAGMSIFVREMWHIKTFVFGCNVDGCQGNARSRFAEAMRDAMKEAGYDATVYYQMD